MAIVEIERRVILFKSSTTMPDGSLLGYNGDPNAANPLASDGEFLIYNCPVGTRYQEDDGTQWYKKSLPNTWLEFGSGSVVEPVITVSSEYTVQISDYGILCDASAGGFIVHLPTALSAKDKHYFLKKIDSSWNIITIDADGSEKIDGELNYLLELEWEFVEIASNGTSWYVTAE